MPLLLRRPRPRLGFLVVPTAALAALAACSSSSNPGGSSTNHGTTSSESEGSSGGGSSESSATVQHGGSSTSSSGGGGQISLSIASTVAVLEAATSTSSCTGGSDAGGNMCTSSTSGQVLVLVLTNRSGVSCSEIDSLSNTHSTFANLEALVLEVGIQTGDLAPGTFKLGSEDGGVGTATTAASADYATTSATCAGGQGQVATSGTITLTSISGAGVAGTYDVAFGSMGSLSGSFNTSICQLPDSGTNGNGGDGGITCIQ